MVKINKLSPPKYIVGMVKADIECPYCGSELEIIVKDSEVAATVIDCPNCTNKVLIHRSHFTKKVPIGTDCLEEDTKMYVVQATVVSQAGRVITWPLATSRDKNHDLSTYIDKPMSIKLNGTEYRVVEVQLIGVQLIGVTHNA